MLLLITIAFLLQCISGKKFNSQLSCGLVGFSSIDYYFSKDKIAQLLYWNQERGKDATGIYSPDTGLKKSLKKAEDYLAEDFWADIKEDITFIGHVRQATYGANNINNCHPFQYGNIVLAHNGTLDLPWVLCNNLGLNSMDYQVDSQVLAASLNKEQNIRCLSKFEGAAAIIFTDTNTPDILYVYRNKERPLFRGIGEEGMYISSIEKSLKAIGCRDIKEFKEDYFYTIKEGKVKSHQKIVKSPFPSTIIKSNASNTNRQRYRHIRHIGEMYMGEHDDETRTVADVIPESVPFVEAMNTYRGKQILNKWLKAERDCDMFQGQKISIKKGKWYFCCAIAKLNSNHFVEQIYVYDENNAKVKIQAFYFDFESMYDLNLTTYVVIMNSLIYTSGSKKGKDAVKKGEIYKITNHGEEVRELFNETTGKIVIVKDIYLRPAEGNEVIENALNIVEDKNKNQIPKKKINMDKLREIEEDFQKSVNAIIGVIDDKKVKAGNGEMYPIPTPVILEIRDALEALKDEFKLKINEVLSEAETDVFVDSES